MLAWYPELKVGEIIAMRSGIANRQNSRSLHSAALRSG
jgi:hypothetical protein